MGMFDILGKAGEYRFARRMIYGTGKRVNLKAVVFSLLRLLFRLGSYGFPLFNPKANNPDKVTLGFSSPPEPLFRRCSIVVCLSLRRKTELLFLIEIADQCANRD